MRFYRTTDVVRLYGGIVFLKEEQISGRKKNLQVGKGGECKVLHEVQFKAGEVIGFELPPKVYANILEPIGPDPQPEAKAEEPPEDPPEAKPEEPAEEPPEDYSPRGKVGRPRKIY